MIKLWETLTSRRGRSAERGFNVIEMAIVTGVSLVLLALAVPVTKSTLDRYNLRSTADAITMQIALARSRAVLTNQKLTFTFTATDLGLSPFDPKAPRQPIPAGYTFAPSLESLPPLQLAPNGTIMAVNNNGVTLVPPPDITITDPEGHSVTINISTAGHVNIS